jgi:hypothetical protein
VWRNNDIRALYCKWALGDASGQRLGIIDENEYRDIGLIWQIRNKFAHSWKSLSFEMEPISKFCQELAKTAPAEVADKEKSNNRVIFVFTVWRLLNQMIWRRQLAEKEKRNSQGQLVAKESRSKTRTF